jgi:hypothetical protein
LYGYLAQLFGVSAGVPASWFLQTAKVLGLASLLAMLGSGVAVAQGTARIEVSANVVNAAPSQRAIASIRWLLGRRGAVRRDNGLATIVVNRERRQVSINYLKN